MYKYIEIIYDKDNEVVKRLDVTNESERTIERVERGMSINLNHHEYSIRIIESEKELDPI